ncbi:hypothetical protein, partial [Thermosynechococcus sp.]|uniref:hypothetical protein n=1 Tax=Thermosynechococcus sp. TaxID=2814275 RepID=UPI00391CF240
PCTLVAILRHLGYSCEEFAPTLSLTAELARLQRWYQLQAKDLAQLSETWRNKEGCLEQLNLHLSSSPTSKLTSSLP